MLSKVEVIGAMNRYDADRKFYEGKGITLREYIHDLIHAEFLRIVYEVTGHWSDQEEYEAFQAAMTEKYDGAPGAE